MSVELPPSSSEPDPAISNAALPRAQVTRPRRPTLVWLVPLGALLAAAFLIYQSLSERGRVIRIRFETGSGIQADHPVVYRGTKVGRVRSVKLSEDFSGVIVTAELNRDSSALAVAGSRFWIVQPVLSISRVSGLDTLLGPRYVEVEPGVDRAAVRSEFVGLEREPVTHRDPRTTATPIAGGGSGELTLLLQASARPTVNVGSPVLYRGVKVGSVITFDLSATAQSVELTVVIEAQYAHLVRSNSVFFNASGIELDVGLSRGLTMRAPSIESVLSGGVEFATPDKPGTQAPNGATFELAAQPPKGAAEWSPDLSPEAGSPSIAK